MQRLQHFKPLFLSLFAAVALSACEGVSETTSASDASQVVTSLDGSPSTGGDAGQCASGDLCLALKIVAYSDGTAPVIDSRTAEDIVSRINGVWSSCGIGFRLEDFQAVEPKNVGLAEIPQNMSELPQIRGALQSSNQLLVVMTEGWGSAGNINDSGADAWTTLPGSPPYGAVIDEPVARNANIIAHELGHYLDLLHIQNRSNLLSPVVGASSRDLTASQCSRARATAQGLFASMLRS
jgi:hypothetical protein